MKNKIIKIATHLLIQISLPSFVLADSQCQQKRSGYLRGIEQLQVEIGQMEDSIDQIAIELEEEHPDLEQLLEEINNYLVNKSVAMESDFSIDDHPYLSRDNLNNDLVEDKIDKLGDTLNSSLDGPKYGFGNILYHFIVIPAFSISVILFFYIKEVIRTIEKNRRVTLWEIIETIKNSKKKKKLFYVRFLTIVYFTLYGLYLITKGILIKRRHKQEVNYIIDKMDQLDKILDHVRRAETIADKIEWHKQTIQSYNNRIELLTCSES